MHCFWCIPVALKVALKAETIAEKVRRGGRESHRQVEII